MKKRSEGHPALFLDLDDTVRKTNAGGRPYPKAPHEQEVLPGRHELLWDYKNKGYKVFGVTNQGAIGAGQLTEAECKHCLEDLNKRLGGVFDNILYAKAHPSKDDPYRKPNPGMIHQLRDEHGVDLKKSIMVGDRDTDKMAAHRAGVKFIWTKDFFNDSHKKA